jgi:hypothetical protein
MAEPIFVTESDYFDFSGILLSIELSGTNTDNPSDIVDVFLTRIEQWSLSYLAVKFGIDENNEYFNLESFKKGLLYQIDYIRINGELSIRQVNEMKLLAPNAFTEWKLGGMCNTALPMPKALHTWV